jgi:Ca2+-binding RTX toxin-like protein
VTVLGNDLDNSISVQAPPSGSYYYQTPVALYGGAGNDTLSGSSSDDLLSGGTGNDSMSGGWGNDTYMVDAAGDVVVEAASGGSDTVVSSLASYTLGAEVENLRLEEAPGAVKGYGNEVGNVLTGNSLDNVLDGKAGADTVYGGAGNDTLNGGAGNDVIQGGSGDDVLDGGDNDSYSYLGYAGDTVSYDGATVKLKVDLSLTGAQATGVGNDTLLNFENLIGGLKSDVLKGNSGANVIIGGGGNDTITGAGGADSLQGGAGDDVIYGGAGIDTLAGGDGNDRFVFDAKEAVTGTSYYSDADRVTDFVKGSDKLAISMAALPVGDGDLVIESAPASAQVSPGGFAAAAEVVVFSPTGYYGNDVYSAASVIGSAASNYAVGDHRLFVVNQPSYYYGSGTAALYYFSSNAADATVTASELQLIGTVTLTSGTTMPGMYSTVSPLTVSDLSFVA